MEYAALALGGVTATISAVVLLNMLGRRLSGLLQRRLGDYYEYAAIFYVVVLCVLALLGFLYFVVPLTVWLASVAAVIGIIVLIILFD